MRPLWWEHGELLSSSWGTMPVLALAQLFCSRVQQVSNLRDEVLWETAGGPWSAGAKAEAFPLSHLPTTFAENS